MTIAKRIARLHERHPDWDASVLARYAGTSPIYVHTVAAKLNFKLPRKPYTPKAPQRGTVVELGRACRAAGLTLADIETYRAREARNGQEERKRHAEGGAQ